MGWAVLNFLARRLNKARQPRPHPGAPAVSAASAVLPTSVLRIPGLL